MKKINIIFVHHSGYLGGAGVSLIDIIISLKQLHVNISVICPNTPNDMKNFLQEMDVNVIDVDNVEIFTHFSGSYNFALSFRMIRNIYRILKNKKNIIDKIVSINPDVVFLNSMTLFYLGKTLKRHGYKTVCFHRETFIHGLFGMRTNYIKKQLGKYFDKVVFISQFDLKEAKLPLDKSLVITDKVDCNLNSSNISNLNFTKDFKYVLYAGGMVDLKGAHIIVNAFRFLPKNIKLIFMQYDKKEYQTNIFEIRNWKRFLKILLNVDYEYKVNKFIEKYNLLQQIEFYDTDRDVSKYFLASDVVVFPSTKPHQSRIIYEAGIYRRPIIISDYENTKEFLKNEYNGITFKPNNSLDLSHRILKCLNDINLTTYIVENNFKETLVNNNLNELKNELESLLNSLFIEI